MHKLSNFDEYREFSAVFRGIKKVFSYFYLKKERMANPELKKSRLLPGRFVTEYRNKGGVFLCLAGSAEVILNNRLYRLKRGMLYIVSPVVTVYRLSQSAGFEGFAILDELEVFYPVIRSWLDTVLRLRIRDTPCLQLTEDDIGRICNRKALIDEKKEALLRGGTEEQTKLTRSMMHLLEQETMLEVLSIFFSSKTVESEPVEKNDSLVYHFIFSLHRNYRTKRNVAFYAAQANLSPGHFSFIIKQKTGQTPLGWIITLTIVNAKILLEQSGKSIKEVAAELNFPEQFTFGKYFKQYVGMSPRQYRAARKTGFDNGKTAGS